MDKQNIHQIPHDTPRMLADRMDFCCIHHHFQANENWNRLIFFAHLPNYIPMIWTCYQRKKCTIYDDLPLKMAIFRAASGRLQQAQQIRFSILRYHVIGMGSRTLQFEREFETGSQLTSWAMKDH